MRSTHSLASALVLLLASPGYAEPLTGGPFVIEFDYENAVFGPGSVEFPEECDEDGCLAGSFAIDQRGVATGNVEFTADFDSDGTHVTGGLSGSFTGKLKGKDAIALLKLKAKLKGALVASGFPDLPMKGVISMVEELNGITQQVTTSGAFKLCAKGQGCEKEAIPPEIEPLGPPEEGGGPWTLSLFPDTDERGVVSGFAIATFPDGSDSINFALRGEVQREEGRVVAQARE